MTRTRCCAKDRHLRRPKFITPVGSAAAGALAARKLPLLGLTDPAQAQEKNWRHGVLLFGDLKYPAGVHQLEYANANAPKGGTVRQAVLGT